MHRCNKHTDPLVPIHLHSLKYLFTDDMCLLSFFMLPVSQGGGADYIKMRRKFKGLWPYMSQDDLRSTEKWAFLENLHIFNTERTALELLAKTMRERRPIGQLMLNFDRSLKATEYELVAGVKENL